MHRNSEEKLVCTVKMSSYSDAWCYLGVKCFHSHQQPLVDGTREELLPMLDSGGGAPTISWKHYISVVTEYMPSTKKLCWLILLPALMGGWGDGSGGMESRQLSAGSGLMDNVPLDQRRRLVFISSALIIQVTWADATLSALCGRKQMVTLRRLLVTYLFPFIKKRIPSFWQNKPDLFPVWATGSILNQRIIYFWK